MDAKLIVIGGDTKTTEIKLKLPVIVGRGRDATLTLPHPLVSRRHCEIFESNGQLVVRDMGSLNGTYVNNERITESVLPANELLTVGTVTFRAIYDSAQDATQESVMPPSTEPMAGDTVINGSSSDSTENLGSLESLKPNADTDSDIMEVEFDDGVKSPSDTSLANQDSANQDVAPATPKDDNDDLAAFLKNLK